MVSDVEARSEDGAEDRSRKDAAVNPLDLGAVTKFITGLAAVAYCTGVVAINTYLHGLGITDFAFAKPKLLLTGALILASFLLSASFPFFFKWVKAARDQKDAASTWKKSYSWGLPLLGLLYFLGLLFAAYLLSFRLESPLGQLRGWWIWQYLGHQTTPKRFLATALIVVGIYGPAYASSNLAFKAKRCFALANWRKNASGMPLEFFHFTMTVAAALFFLIGYIIIFTFVFYPSIPVEFGGGEAYFQSFAVADAQLCQLQQMGIPFDEKHHRITRPLPVLHETDTMVAVWLRRNPAEPRWSRSASNDDGKGNKSGLGDYDFVVVQFDKGAVVATRAYPNWKRVTTLADPTPACDADSNNTSPEGTPPSTKP